MSKPNVQLKRVGISVLVGIGIAVWIGLSVDTLLVAPDHAIVLIPGEGGTYLAPVCVAYPGAYVEITLAQAHRLKLEPEKACRDTGAFTQEGRSLLGLLLERVGILGPLPSRWNPDGSWNW